MNSPIKRLALLSGLTLALGATAFYAVSSATVVAEEQELTTKEAAQTERKVLYWYDPMSPQQKFDQPGKSPFMDMQLVPRYADEGGDS
ncbi:heavy metal-binding domain-containing protein, partial [Pseudomonas sp. sp1636]|uniref:heavy metal-binding domain-containing protein n=1 Tax=Pseudomonas sp. sp1636 TaxID=3036707 RepID=UPI0025A6329D